MLPVKTVETKICTGAKIIVETLKNLGVDSIFGYPGGVVMPLYDELFKQEDIKHYLVRHEQAAVHAAEGYARVSGKCGVVLVTSGPGASNTVSGIVNAYIDGYPLVVLTGQVSSELIGKDAFQEVNIIDITKTCTKAGFQVKDANDIEEVLIKAFKLATDGKKGPVVVDIARDVFAETSQFVPVETIVNESDYVSEYSIRDALNNIIVSKKAVVVAGGGVTHSKASDALYKLVKTLNIPVVSTMMGLGTYPQDDKNYLGMIGIFGQPSANKVLQDSDLILSVGARFNDRITCCFNPQDLSKKFIQIEINEKEISRTIPATSVIIGDAKIVLDHMNKMLLGYVSNNSDWLNYAINLKYLNKTNKPVSNKIQSFEIINKIYNLTKDYEPYISTEVGQHQLWVAQNYKFSKPGRFITSGGTGTMGFGFPAAIGASIALGKQQPVICVAGDGSFQMNEQELATCAEYNLPVKIFVMNNGYLGMVRQLQEKSCEGRYSETKIFNPDFVKLANAYGIEAERVSEIEKVEKAINNAILTKGPYLVEFVIEPMEIV